MNKTETTTKPKQESAIRFARHSFDNLQSLARFADTKGGTVFALLLFLAGWTAATLKDVFKIMATGTPATEFAVPLACSWLLFGIITIKVCTWLFRALAPRSATHYRQADRKRDLLYWDHILQHQSMESYHHAVSEMDEALELSNLTGQSYELAFIVKAKLDAISAALRLIPYWLLAWFGTFLFSAAMLARLP